MTFINIVALTVTAIYLMLGGIVYAHSRRQMSEIFFGLLSLCLTAWGLATFLTVSTSQSALLFKIGIYAHYVAGNLIFLSFFWFSVYFPARTKRSLILPLLLALISNLSLPAFGQFTFFAMGPIFGIFFVICIAYAVFEHNLLNVKIVATEFFVSLIILILVIEVFSANSILEFVIN